MRSHRQLGIACHGGARRAEHAGRSTQSRARRAEHAGRSTQSRARRAEHAGRSTQSRACRAEHAGRSMQGGARSPEHAGWRRQQQSAWCKGLQGAQRKTPGDGVERSPLGRTGTGTYRGQGAKQVALPPPRQLPTRAPLVYLAPRHRQSKRIGLPGGPTSRE